MLVRVKKGLGNYGHIQDGYVQPKNYASGVFEVTEEKACELVARGVVDVVGSGIDHAPHIPEPEPAPEQPKKAVKVTKKAPKKAEKKAKKETKKAIETADDVPTFDAIGGVE